MTTVFYRYFTRKQWEEGVLISPKHRMIDGLLWMQRPNAFLAQQGDEAVYARATVKGNIDPDAVEPVKMSQWPPIKVTHSWIEDDIGLAPRFIEEQLDKFFMGVDWAKGSDQTVVTFLVPEGGAIPLEADKTYYVPLEITKKIVEAHDLVVATEDSIRKIWQIGDEMIPVSLPPEKLEWLNDELKPRKWQPGELELRREVEVTKVGEPTGRLSGKIFGEIPVFVDENMPEGFIAIMTGKDEWRFFKAIPDDPVVDELTENEAWDQSVDMEEGDLNDFDTVPLCTFFDRTTWLTNLVIDGYGDFAKINGTIWVKRAVARHSVYAQATSLVDADVEFEHEVQKGVKQVTELMDKVMPEIPDHPQAGRIRVRDDVPEMPQVGDQFVWTDDGWKQIVPCTCGCDWPPAETMSSPLDPIRLTVCRIDEYNTVLKWQIGFEIPEHAGYKLPPGHDTWRFYDTGHVSLFNVDRFSAYIEAVKAMNRQMNQWIALMEKAKS